MDNSFLRRPFVNKAWAVCNCLHRPVNAYNSDCGARDDDVKIYLNVSTLNRLFDDQEQARIRLEAAAVGMILERVDEGRWIHVSSEMAQIEIDAIPDPKRQARVRLLLP